MNLAQCRGGNRSRVVREALVTLADMEDRLDKIKAHPAFLERMRQSDEDIRTGRIVSHEEGKRRLRRNHSEKR